MTKNNVANSQDILNLMLANTNQEQIQRLAFVNTLNNVDFPLEDILVYEDDLLSFVRNNLYKDDITGVYTFDKEIADKLNTCGTSRVLRDKSLMLVPAFYNHIQDTHILSNEELNSIFDYALVRVKSTMRELIEPLRILLDDKIDLREVLNNFDETDDKYPKERVEYCKKVVTLHNELKYQLQLCMNTVTPNTLKALKSFMNENFGTLRVLFYADRYNILDVNAYRLIKDFTVLTLTNLTEFIQLLGKCNISLNFLRNVSFNDLCECAGVLRTLASEGKYQIILNDLLKSLADTITSNYDLEMKGIVTLVLNDTPDKVWEFLVPDLNKYVMK